MIGQTLGHYRIESKLGEGGMGAVWKARDIRLDRFVALKTLPAEKLADAERRRRFTQEAKAASALNHPNIVHIYDIADADAVPFIAMEYVAGKTLDQLIGRQGLRLNETLKYAIQIADALARAHSASIIHRDLKPSNIMVDEHGLVKVLDFGLAKLTETATGELGETATMRVPERPDTEEGTILGTVAYMSPEQAEGKPIDANSAAFTFTFTSDTDLVAVPFCCGTDFSTPAGTHATFSIAGIGSGTFTDDQAVFENPNPAELTVGIWHFNMPDVLDLSRRAFTNYDLSTNMGPIFVEAPFAFSNGFSTTLGDFILDSATNVTYKATVSTTEVPEPSSLSLFISGLAACVAVYVIRGATGVR